jgi:hypothetical protein
MLIISWKWQPNPGYRTKFTSHHVNHHYAMVKRNLTKPFEYVCITDDPVGIDPNIKTIALWDDFANIPNPSGKSWPSCYRRLKVFEANASKWLGEKIISMDLDVVITGNLDHLTEIKEDFAIWQLRDSKKKTAYCGSLWFLKTGTRSQVWNDFDPITSPQLAKKTQHGSDQAWIAHATDFPKEKRITWDEHGVYSFKQHIKKQPDPTTLPANTCMVIFHGEFNPWDQNIQETYPWAKHNWKL